MTVLLSALAFLILLSALILIHEWGHYIVARKAGVVVEEFGFGLPPRVKKLFKRGRTAFTLNWIPFGGFVRLKGENALDEKERKAKGSFGAASIPARIFILCAGVFMNFVLAILLLTIGFSAGRWIPTFLTIEQMEAAQERGDISMELSVLVTEVISGESAARAGVTEGSLITAINDEPVSYPDDVSLLQEGKRRVSYTLLTGDDYSEEKKITVSLKNGKSGIVVTAQPRNVYAPQRNVITAFMLSLRESKVMTVQTVYGMGRLFYSLASTGRVPEGITGIVGIAQLTHASVQQGFMTYLRLVALLSLSLAVLNILPFPALDGGRLLFVFAEIVRRKPVNRRFELLTNAIGFTFLLFLIFLITFHDIIRLF